MALFAFVHEIVVLSIHYLFTFLRNKTFLNEKILVLNRYQLHKGVMSNKETTEVTSLLSLVKPFLVILSLDCRWIPLLAESLCSLWFGGSR